MIMKYKHCPSCNSEIKQCIEPMKNDKGELRMRPMKRPWLRCVLVACRRAVNYENGDVFHHGKLTKNKEFNNV